MAHFSNGGERRSFQDHFCGRCANDRGDGCIINLIYDLFDFGTTNPGEEDTRAILDLLIVENRDANTVNTFSCSMFLEGAESDGHQKEENDELIDSLIGPEISAAKFQGGTLLTRTEAGQ